jgi:uncharacterized membrane protein YeaQ/YmgE (transglycosylase-associated protein family)
VNARLRYLLLFAVAAAPLAIVTEIKPGPLVLLGGLFASYAAASLATRGSAPAPVRDVLAAGLLAVLLLLGSAFVLVAFASWVAPPVTSDGHPVMAIGQTFLGSAGGVVAGAALTFVALRRRWRDRTLESILLHVIGAAIVAAAVVRVVREAGPG